MGVTAFVLRQYVLSALLIDPSVGLRYDRHGSGVEAA